MNNPTVASIGCSEIAQSHLASAQAAGFRPIWVAGSGKSTRLNNVARQYSCEPVSGSEEILNALVNLSPTALLLATPPDITLRLLRELAELKWDGLVVAEKPASTSSEDLFEVSEIARTYLAFVAYNRRFYPSVALMRELIQDSVSPLSFKVSIGEFVDGGLSPQTVSTALLTNSVHLFDLLHYLDNSILGSLESEFWLPDLSEVAVLGKSRLGLFSLSVTFNKANLHALEISSTTQTLELKPIEALSIFRGMEVQVDDSPSMRRNYSRKQTGYKTSYDVDGLKPGFRDMWIWIAERVKTPSFDMTRPHLPNLLEAAESLRFAERIFASHDKASGPAN